MKAILPDRISNGCLPWNNHLWDKKIMRNFFEKGIDFIGKPRYNVELYETL